MSEPLHPSVLALICQIQAIDERTTGPASDFTANELEAIHTALRRATRKVAARRDWLKSCGPDHGRAA